MKETTGNIWDHLGTAIICITTNGHLTKKGEAVLGRGCARQARERFPGLPARLGAVLAEGGNHVHVIGDGLVSFPVEESPWANPDLRPSGAPPRNCGRLPTGKGGPVSSSPVPAAAVAAWRGRMCGRFWRISLTTGLQ